MTIPQPQVCCPNLDCPAPLNDAGNTVCSTCQTPLVYRYLWAVGEAVLTIPVGSIVKGRYYVKSPQIWLDTQPALLPDFPPLELPDNIQAYLFLIPHHLHLPTIFGVCSTQEQEAVEPAEAGTLVDSSAVLLLENAPLDSQGKLFPAIAQVWASASPVRQAYWLYQILELWEPLSTYGASASLLISDNIRVDGWKVHLCQLFWDESILEGGDTSDEFTRKLSLADLATLWLEWIEQSEGAIAERLQSICYTMQTNTFDVGEILYQLNSVLLEFAAQLPLRLKVAGATDTGPKYTHNEDTCYPLKPVALDDTTSAQFVVVCDGIGGHEGGEIASQLAVQSLKLQTQALIAETSEQTDLFPPDIVAQQLEAIIRVVNDLIANQNNAQGRESRKRMGTTLVMGLQLPQMVRTVEDTFLENSHELYLVNVGDSRAYWITPRSCHRLTLDDDVSIREVRMGRMLYREALQRPDAGSLIQALGTHASEFLHPTLQRLVLEEDGVLLLCSDGLSDNDLVENNWFNLMQGVFQGQTTLEKAANAWVALANEKNGHDNVSVVLLQCQVTTSQAKLGNSLDVSSQGATGAETSSELPQSREAINPSQTRQPEVKPRSSWFVWLSILTLFLLVGGFVALTKLSPSLLQPQREQITPEQ